MLRDSDYIHSGILDDRKSTDGVFHSVDAAISFGKENRHICSPFHVDNYFQIVPKSIEFTKSELDEIMYKMPKEQILDVMFNHFTKGTLERLMDEIKTHLDDPNRLMTFIKIIFFDNVGVAISMIKALFINRPFQAIGKYQSVKQDFYCSIFVYTVKFSVNFV